MSLSRRNPRRDAVEPELIAVLQRCGWYVMRVSIPNGPDLILAAPGRGNVLAEVKSGTAQLREGQRDWFETWPGPKVILRTVEDVLALVKAR